ncbi:excisionase family DNA-binding protein [Chloroflexota bacterium]
MQNDALTLTVEQTAKALSISKGLCYQLVRKGRITSLRLGHRIVIPKIALDALLSEDVTDAE